MLEFLNKMKAQTVEKIEGALLSLDADIETAAKSRERAQGAVEAAIEGGDERGLIAAESAVDAAQRQLDRLNLARATLTRRLDQARANEARESRAKARADAEALRDKARKRLASEGADAARKLVAVLESVAAANKAVDEINTSMIQANPDAVPFVERIDAPVVVIPASPEWEVAPFNWTEPPVNWSAVLASAYPPGSVGNKGEIPRVHVSRPAAAGLWSHP